LGFCEAGSFMTKRYHYTIYGFHVVSNKMLPGVVLAQSKGEDARKVRIHFVEGIASLPVEQPADQYTCYVHPYKDENGVPALQVWREKSTYYLAYLGGSRFIIQNEGDMVWAAWSDENCFESVAAQLLGPILGFVLQLRGFLVLHGSVAAWDGQAFAILGASGAGKSTLAAQLTRQGCQVLSDDIAALFRCENLWWVQPGYPRLRLWPESAEAIYGTEHNLNPIVPGNDRWVKRYLELNSPSTAFGSNPLPFRSIFVLNWSEEGNTQLRISRLKIGEALANLDAHSYMVYLLDRDQHQRQMTDLANLLSQIPVYQVQPVLDLAALPDLGAAILARSKT
jgi:hypothetical protein